MLQSPRLDDLITALNRLPGIGRKTAQRLAWHLIGGEKSRALELANAIISAAESFAPCKVCNLLAETDPCQFCSSVDRDDSQLCLVENNADVAIIENMHEYRGRYYILGHLLSPLDGFGPEQLGIHKLMKLIDDRAPDELILALKPSAEGEATIHYLTETLKAKPIRITRLSTGLPFGGDLEYSSILTLSNAWKRRYPV
ncbi:MAG TPA: recombination mediator RecR [Candidatus Cloacimonadota bacterium]|nr:recombination mediator RecR [Candidatus Cloacimonadota bacterium]HOH78431.1 recombination mediator RecR [Candidatus Cloacimonadota bacterium]